MSRAPTLELPAIISTQVAFSKDELDGDHETGLNSRGRHHLFCDLRKAATQILDLFYYQDMKPKKAGELMVVRVNIFTVGEEEYTALQRAKAAMQKAVKEGRASGSIQDLSRELQNTLKAPG